MRFKRIYNENELYDGIYCAYEGDNEIMSRFDAYEQGTLEECVFETLCTIKNAIEKSKCEWYQILFDDEIIGYLVMSREHSFVYSLGVNVNYRMQHLTDIMHGYIYHLGRSMFIHALWANDNSGIEYLKNQGKKIHRKDMRDISKLN
jgi:hypothetical protein